MDELTQCSPEYRLLYTTTSFASPETSIDNVTDNEQHQPADVVNEYLLDAGTLLVVVVCCIVFTLSAAGNSTVLYVIGRHLRYCTSTNIFVTVLSLSDLTSVVVCLPLTVSRLLQNSTSFSTPSDFGSIACTVENIVGVASDLVSTAMLSLLAVDRYSTTVRQRRAPFVAQRTFAIVAFCVSGSAILASAWFTLRVTVLIGNGTGSVISSQTVVRRWLSVCLLTRMTVNYQFAYVAVLTGCPAVLMIYCAARLARVVVQSWTRVRPTTTAANQLLFHDELQTAITVIVMVTVYIVLRLSKFVLLMFVVAANNGTGPHTLPYSSRSIDAAATLVVWVNGAVNPFVYAARNPNVARFLQVDLGILGRFRRRGYLTDTTASSLPAAVTSAVVGAPSTISAIATTGAAAIDGLELPVSRSTASPNDDTYSTAVPSETSSSVTDLRNTVPRDTNRKWFVGRTTSAACGELPLREFCEDDDDSRSPSVDQLTFDSLVMITNMQQQRKQQSVTSSSSSSEFWNSKRKRSASIPHFAFFTRRQSSDLSSRAPSIADTSISLY